RRGREAAHAGGLELGHGLERHRAAEMLAEEGEELADVAPMGLDRLRRLPPFGGEVFEPAHELGRHIAGGRRQIGLVRLLRHRDRKTEWVFCERYSRFLTL